jgi:hypothetical protein
MGFEREVVEAELALGRIAAEDLPKLAWDALESGLDGPATRRLAALDRPKHFDVEKILTMAMQEWGSLVAISKEEAGVRLAKRRAREILLGTDDILLHTRDFDELWRQTDYCVELKDCGVIHDEVERLRLYGRYDGELRKWMRRELERLIEM